MTGFVTIAILICQLNASNQHPKDLFCYDKGIENLRGLEIKKIEEFTYYKCSDKYYKDCNTSFDKNDGCKFTLTSDVVYFSSSTCP